MGRVVAAFFRIRRVALLSLVAAKVLLSFAGGVPGHVA
jgi:hypothetical protein